MSDAHLNVSALQGQGEPCPLVLHKVKSNLREGEEGECEREDHSHSHPPTN